MKKNSIESYDYLWYLILSGKQNEKKKLKQTQIQSFSPYSMVGTKQIKQMLIDGLTLQVLLFKKNIGKILTAP